MPTGLQEPKKGGFEISLATDLYNCCSYVSPPLNILVPRGRAPFGQHQESRPLVMSKTASPRFTDFPSVYACSEPSLPNLIGSGLNLLCLQSHSNPECRWIRPEVAILGADQTERGLWRRECPLTSLLTPHVTLDSKRVSNTFFLSCA